MNKPHDSKPNAELTPVKTLQKFEIIIVLCATKDALIIGDYVAWGKM